MNTKNLRTILSVIAIICFILFIANKAYLRPHFQYTKPLSVILGSLPNFLGAYVFCLIPIQKLAKPGKINRKIYFYSYSLFIFILLISEEFFPFLTASKVFDLFDIIASGIGCFAAIVSYEYYIKIYDKENL